MSDPHVHDEQQSCSSSNSIPEQHPEEGFLDIDLGDGCLPPVSSRVCVRSTAPYIADQGFERYQPALRNLIPVRHKPSKRDDVGVDSAGLVSFVLSTWLSKLMYKAYRKGLVIEDIPLGSPHDSCDLNVQRLEKLWQEELGKHGPSGASFSRAVWRFIRTRVVADCVVFTTSCILGFLTPMIFMRKLLEFAEDPDASFQTGLIWALLLMLCELCRIFFFSWRWVMSFRTASRLRIACIGLMYKKLIRLSNFEEKSMGQLVNIFANDSQRIFDVVLFGPMIIGGPMVLISGVVYVLSILSPQALAGVFVFVAFYPVQYFISRISGLIRGKNVRVTDERISLMSEILTYIKTIKMNSWESYFSDQVHYVRTKEQSFIEKTSYLSSLGVSLAPTVPILSAIVTFLTHLGSGHTLSAAQAFSIQAVFSNSIRNVVRVLGYGLSSIFDAITGLKRVQKCLLIEEVQLRVQRPIDRSQAVAIGGATFTWGSTWSPSVTKTKKERKKKMDEPIKKSDVEAAIQEREKLTKDANEIAGIQPVLQGISFSAPKGHLVGVCGPVGSGKTSLLLAILGQMRLVNGQMARDGSCAFVSQQAWIINGTLRDNVLFGEAFVSTRYYNVISSCALNNDVNELPGGDLTEIGDRGINLSGGQKQRVALARALYANRDIYLLDDPLSAVDVNVGATIFENYIQRQLRNKTVILVSHQIQYLSQCDEVYVMKGGHIVERGTHESLLELNKEYASMMNQSNSIASGTNAHQFPSGLENGSAITNGETSKPVNYDKRREAGDMLIVEEPFNAGSLKTDTYWRYISAAGGYLMAALVFFVFLCNLGSIAFSSWWLATWIKAGGGNTTMEVNNVTVWSTNLGDNPDYVFYQTIYASTIGFILLTCALRCFVFTRATIRASSVIHHELFQKIIHSPMLFFETNPIGRLQNIFSRDLDDVDSRLPPTIENIIGNFWIMAFAVLFICIVFPWFFVAFIPISVIYYFVSRIFRKGIRDLKRLDNTSRSPIFSKLVETMHGLNTVRAFNKEGEYIQRFFQLCDENATCSYLWNVGMRWLAVRIDLLAAATMSITALLVVFLHGSVVPAMAGLALSYSWHISGVLQYTTRLISETEVRFLSVERILAYIDTAVVEGKSSSTKPPPTWPNEGHINFKNVCLSYRKNLPNALSNISFNVLPGEKIGIVGRTGSGKSSLTAALFRLVELNNGHIKVDGVDISDICLSVLRDKISIVPQDQVLFSGTIRSNLDRKNKCSDKEMWDALTKTRLSDRVASLPKKLDTVVSSGSCGLSVGECQLLCLARALLKNSKILVLDEATASIDPETEAAVQTTIQEEFKSSTVFIIAHRLATISFCDRILVMNGGKVIEFDSPEKLLANSDSEFAKMMASSESILSSSKQ